MKADDIDNILDDIDREDPRRQAASLPPMKFPWLRLLPGILAMFLAIMRVVWDLLGFLNEPDVVAAFKEQLSQFADVAAQFGVQWIVLAVAITVVSLMLSISLVGSEQHAPHGGRIRRLLRAAASIIRKSG